jgi:hypothetical protein
MPLCDYLSTSDQTNRFFGLFGMYFSLQYLSLSDAVVLTFLAPFCAGISGSIFLGENFTRKEAFASRKYHLTQQLASESDCPSFQPLWSRANSTPRIYIWKPYQWFCR